MALVPGSRLGPYEILAAIGAGGMGEVYRATDTKLKRQVAIKILPPALATDHDRLARFQREAEVLASLNHPHVAHIYGLDRQERQDGQDGTLFIVMELVDGEDLSQRIARGAIPIDEALPIATQIAEALEAAHEQGIVHRDLKPANIKVRADGTVKVLDFGLAKAMEPAGAASASASMSPTLSLHATQAGMILGTAAYMSPEQARGKTVDRRADIWAFGVVLYEMLTGRRAFEDEDVSMTLSQILQREPDFAALPPTVPRRVTQALRVCLRKDPKQRIGDIRDVRLALEGAFESTAAATATSTAPPASGGRLLWMAALLVSVVAIVALLIPAVQHLRELPPDLRVVNTTLLPPEGGEFAFVSVWGLPAISPDGTRIVFGARTNGKAELWVRRLDTPTAQPLPGTEDAAHPFWSPDSRWVGFGQGTKLKKIDVQGGPAVPITDLSAPLRGASWSQQGVIVFGVNAQGPLQRVASAGGPAAPTTVLQKGNEPENHRYPWFLPDGRHFLYTDSRAGDLPVAVGSIDEPDKPGKVVAQVHSSVAYAQGHLLYLRESTLMAQPFDVDRLQTTAEAVPLVEGVPTYSSPSRVGGFAVSPGGLLGSATGGSGVSRLVWKDREGKILGTLGEPAGQIGNVEMSPDGTRVAVSRPDRGIPEDLWIYETARGIPTKFTFDPNADRSPVWSPDNATLYFSSARNRGFDLYRRPSNATATEEVLLVNSQSKQPTSVTSDGKQLLFSQTGPQGTDLLLLPLGDTQTGAKIEPRVFLQTPFNERNGQFSPDGQWVVYASDESGQGFQIYVLPFPGPGGKRQISSGGGINPRWRRDGKEIFYATADGQLMAAEVTARGGTLEVGRVQKLFDGIVTTRGTTYDVSLDGQKFLVADDGIVGARPLTLVQNWTALLRK